MSHRPTKWISCSLGDVATTFSGGTPSRSRPEYFGGAVPWIKSGELNQRLILATEETLTRLGVEKSSAKEVPAGTTLIALYGATAGVVGRTKIAAAINQAVLAVLPDAEKLDASFLPYLLSRTGRDLLRMVQGAQPNLNAGMVRAAEILLPPLSEQRKIAAILGAWDEALEKLDALLAAKERRKQALLQQLLSGPHRAGGKPWPRALLADVAEEVSRRNGTTLDRRHLYAVTKAEGMVPMRENVQGATIDRCKIVERGWFAYNPMRLNIGSIARWEGDAPVMVSPDYVVFRAREVHLLSDYLNHVRRAAVWTDFVGASGNGSVRVRIWFDDLGRLKIPLPPLAEQRAIADVLDAADAELRLLRQQRAALDRQKRGLMQQLLTGRIRVKP